MKIYIDESGDLGFGPGASEYFIIAALIVGDELSIRRCFKNIRRCKLKKNMKDIPEFKYNNSTPEIKRRVFKCLSKCDLEIGYIILRKNCVQSHFKNDIQKIYRDLVSFLVTDIVSYYETEGPVNIFIDKSLYGIQREDFDSNIIFKMIDNPQNGIVEKDLISINHVASEKEPCIQAVDFIAGAVNKMHRSDDGVHYRIIEDKVIIKTEPSEYYNKKT